MAKWHHPLALLVLAIVGFLSGCADTRPTVYYIARSDASQSLDGYQTAVIRQILTQWGDVQFSGDDIRLEVVVSENGQELESCYETVVGAIDSGVPVIGILDNSWGEEIAPLVDTIQKIPSPIVFLNGDHGGVDFNGNESYSRVFIGNSDKFGVEVKRFLADMQRFEGFRQILSIGEKGFVATHRANEAIDALAETYTNNVGANRGLHTGKVEMPRLIVEGKELVPSRADIERIKAEIREQIQKASEDAEAYNQDLQDQLASDDINPEKERAIRAKIDTIQKRPLIVLTSHSTLGHYILSWLDEEFDGFTVVCHQSSLKRGRIYFNNSQNRLIVLSHMAWSVSRPLLDYESRLSALGDIPERDGSGVFFVRRCLIGTEILRQATAGTESFFDSTLNMLVRYRRLNRVANDIAAESMSTPIGQIKFGRDADTEQFEEMRGHATVQHLEGVRYPFTHQIVYPSIPQTLEDRRRPGRNLSEFLVSTAPVVTIQFEDIKISELSMETGTFQAHGNVIVGLSSHAGTLGVIEDGSSKYISLITDPVLRPSETLPVLRSEGGESRRFLTFANAEAGNVQFIPIDRNDWFGFTKQRFRFQGVFAANVEASDFPFDSQRISLDLATFDPSSEFRLTVFEYNERSLTSDGVAGWQTIEVDSSFSRNALEIVEGPRYWWDAASIVSQYEVASVEFHLQRSLARWTLLITLPLSLVVVMSILSLWVGGNELATSTLRFRAEMLLGVGLALALYLVSYVAAVPRIDVITSADLLTLSALVFVGVCLLTVTLASVFTSLFARGKGMVYVVIAGLVSGLGMLGLVSALSVFYVF